MLRMVSADVSISMSSEQTRAQVWKVVWRISASVTSDIRVTSNIGIKITVQSYNYKLQNYSYKNNRDQKIPAVRPVVTEYSF